MGIKSILLAATALVLSANVSAAQITWDIDSTPLAFTGGSATETDLCQVLGGTLIWDSTIGDLTEWSVSVSASGPGSTFTAFEYTQSNSTLSLFHGDTSFVFNASGRLLLLVGAHKPGELDIDQHTFSFSHVHEQVPGMTRFTNVGQSLSSVPVPPAIWLFGSGLIGLIGLARRRKS